MGERRESNPRMLEPQPSALTTWLRSPKYVALLNYIINNIILRTILPRSLSYSCYF